jgi:hypothetical protein
MNHLIPTGLATWVARLALLLSFCAGLATAQTNSNSYTFLLGSGFLCDGNDASTCPATAKAVQGDSYEMSGAGTFDAQNKSVKAAGTFSHKSANGNVAETGVWIASELVSFVSYGIAPGALLQEKSRLNALQFAPMRLKISSGPMPTGGLGIFRVRLLTLSGAVKTGVLHVNCALGDVPRERSVEGIRLSLESERNDFSEEVSGRVMFLSMRRQVNAPANAPQQEVSTGTSEPPPN